MTKILTLMVSPLGGVFLLLVLAGWWLWRDERGKALGAIMGTFLWVYAWSCPWVASGVTRWWEARVPAPALEDVPVVEVVVTLGGAMSGAIKPRQDPDLNDAGDRLWHAARLYPLFANVSETPS